MRHRTLHALILVTTALAGGGCATGSSPIGPDRHSPQARLVVENNSWLDMKIYLDHGSSVIPLGTVVSMERRQLRLPAFAVSSHALHLVADPIGSAMRYSSGELPFWPGRETVWRLENQMNHSVVLMR